MIGLIETEIERDLKQRATASEETTDFEENEKRLEGQNDDAVSDDFDGEDEDLDDEPDESEEHGMSMGM
ncbi:MAG: hypothetical protein K2J80_09280 [Oscillospiraceae bacterium]|nr:hypothetical protein [Oscillospiraceae bacterium]